MHVLQMLSQQCVDGRVRQVIGFDLHASHQKVASVVGAGEDGFVDVEVDGGAHV